MAVAYSANGKYLLSGNEEGVQMWRAKDKDTDTRRIAELAAKSVKCLAISKDGKRVAAGTSSGDVVVWNAKRFREVPVISRRNDTSSIHGVDFSPDSTRIIIASENHTASILGIDTVERIALRHKGSVIAAKYSPEGNRIATATENCVRVYECKGNDLRFKLLANIKAPVTSYYNTSLLWESNEQLIVISDDKIKTIAFPFRNEPKDLLIPNIKTYSPRRFALLQDGKYAVCASRRKITFWTWSDSKSQYTQLTGAQIDHNEEIHSIAAFHVQESQDNQSLAVSPGQESQDHQSLSVSPGQESQDHQSLAVSPGQESQGHQFLAVGGTGRIVIIDSTSHIEKVRIVHYE